jgi:hypothetical protein
MGDAGLRQFFHVFRVPDSPAQRHSFGHPGYVHAPFRSPSDSPSDSARNHPSQDYSDSTSPYPIVLPTEKEKGAICVAPFRVFFFLDS